MMNRLWRITLFHPVDNDTWTLHEYASTKELAHWQVLDRIRESTQVKKIELETNKPTLVEVPKF